MKKPHPGYATPLRTRGERQEAEDKNLYLLLIP